MLPRRIGPAIQVGAAALAACAPLACTVPPEILSTSTPANTFDPSGPYQISSVTRGGADKMEIFYCNLPDCLAAPTMDGSPTATFKPVTMQRLRTEHGDSTWAGSIPGQPQGTQVGWYVAASGSAHRTDPPEAERTDAGRRLYAFQVRAPGGPCALDTDCGPGELCDASKVCRLMLATCVTDDDCQAEYRCDGHCVLRTRHCAASVDCLIGERCDRPASACVPRAACMAAGDCPKDTLCDATAHLCRAFCAVDLDCDESESCQMRTCVPRRPCAADCPAGLKCETGGSCRAVGAAICNPCTADVDCGDAEDFCIVPAGKLVGACARACSKGPCGPGYECRTEYDPPQCVPTTACK